MKIGKIESKLKSASGISLIEIIEMPSPIQHQDEIIQRTFIVNIGPIPFDDSTPRGILQQSLSIANKVAAFLSNRPECSQCIFGISIFSEPGDQSGRVFAGTIEVGKVKRGVENIPKIQDARSNNRDVDALLRNAG